MRPTSIRCFCVISLPYFLNFFWVSLVEDLSKILLWSVSDKVYLRIYDRKMKFFCQALWEKVGVAALDLDEFCVDIDMFGPD